MIHYKDFVTGAPKKTRGKFSKWERGGPLNAWYARVECPRSVLFIPHYCLTVESRRALPPLPKATGAVP